MSESVTKSSSIKDKRLCWLLCAFHCWRTFLLSIYPPPNGIEASAHASASSNGGASGASLPLWLAPVRCIQTLVSIPYPSPCDWLWWVCSPKYTNPCLDILSMAWWWNWQDETKQQSLCLCDGHHWICSVCSTEWGEKITKSLALMGMSSPSPRRKTMLCWNSTC